MTEPPLSLPILLGGRRLHVEEAGEPERFDTAAGGELHLPRVDLSMVQSALADAAERAAALRALPLDDITLFFDKVGRAWRSPSNPWRELVVDAGPSVTGYASAFVEWDANLIGFALMRAKQYDFLETDLDEPLMLDEWVPSKAVYRRYWPKGTISHVMVGNVPMASLFTLYRSLATKNLTIAKLPKRDPLTALAFANCIYDTDPEHPVAQALSVFYWSPASPVEEHVLRISDAVSVWGQARSVEAVKRAVPAGTDVIEFGPKRSVTLVWGDVEKPETVAVKMAYDVVSYEQEGCFSMQEAFVVGDPSTLVGALCDALASYADRFPTSVANIDHQAHVQRARLEADAYGWEVHSPDDSSWTVIVTDGPCQIDEHPLSRTLYVHPMDDWTQVLPYVDRNLQTVAVAPWSRYQDVADALSEAGADRVVQVGRMARFRPGFIHDGFYPMRRMVRLSSIERGLDYKYRFMSTSEEEDEQRIYFDGIRSAEELPAS